MAWRPLSDQQEKTIVDAIQEAERNCSGEIRVHLDQYCKGDPMFKARNIFQHLKMDETKDRNSVLIYVALEDHKFCILGDSGVHEKVSQTFWDATRDAMLQHLKQKDVVRAISEAVLECGRQLKHHFPYTSDDTNELPDDISYE